MIAKSNEKLLICASVDSKRLKSVSLAVERMARLLTADIEVLTFKRKSMPIYVYYKCGEDDPIPLFSDIGGHTNFESVYLTLGNMISVLSFHPAYSSLARIRKEFMPSS